MSFPVIPNEHALAVLLMTGVALYLFTRENVPLETSSLFVLVILVIGFELFPFYDDTGHVAALNFFLRIWPRGPDRRVFADGGRAGPGEDRSARTGCPATGPVLETGVPFLPCLQHW